MSMFGSNNSIYEPPLSWIEIVKRVSSFMQKDHTDYSGFKKMKEVRTPNNLSFLQLNAFVMKIAEQLSELTYFKNITHSQETAINMAINSMSLVFLYKTKHAKSVAQNPQEQSLQSLIKIRVDNLKYLLTKQPQQIKNKEFNVKDQVWKSFLEALHQQCKNGRPLTYVIVKPVFYDIMIKVYKDLVNQIKKTEIGILKSQNIRVAARVIYSISLTRKNDDGDFYLYYFKWHSTAESIKTALTQMSLDDLDRYFREAESNHLMDDINHLIKRYLNHK